MKGSGEGFLPGCLCLLLLFLHGCDDSSSERGARSIPNEDVSSLSSAAGSSSHTTSFLQFGPAGRTTTPAPRRTTTRGSMGGGRVIWSTSVGPLTSLTNTPSTTASQSASTVADVTIAGASTTTGKAAPVTSPLVLITLTTTTTTSVKALADSSATPLRAKLFDSRHPFLDIVASADAYVADNEDGNVNGKNENLVSWAHNRRTLLRFKLPGDAAVFGGRASIARAEISLWQTSASCNLSDSEFHTLHALSDTWDLGTLSSYNIPSVLGEVARWSPKGPGFVTANITAHLQTGVLESAASSGELAFAISTNVNKWCKYISVSGSGWWPGEWPRLRLWFKDAPLVQASTAHLPDFASAGYLHGAKAVPEVTGRNWRAFRVDDFVVSGASDEDAIRIALASAESHLSDSKDGLRGAVLEFSPRRYNISASAWGSPIFVKQSRVIWRGAGSNLTTIAMEHPLDPKNASEMWSTPYKIVFGPSVGKVQLPASPEVAMLTGQHASGSHTVTVREASKLVPGMWVRISASVKQTSVTWTGLLGNHRIDPKWTEIAKPEGLKVQEIHQLKKLRSENGIIYVDLVEPMHAAIDADGDTDWAMTAFEHIEEVGVEGIRFLGNFHETFEHHKSAYHDSGFSALQFKGVVHGYIRDCIFQDVNQAVSLKYTAASSVLFTRIRGNPGHCGITVEFSSHNFVGFSEDECGQFHSFGTSHHAAGNVFHHVAWPGSTSYQLHATQPYNTLFDNVRAGWSTGHMGGNIRNYPNHLSGLVLWNFQVVAEGKASTGFPLRDGRPQGFCGSGYSGCVIDPVVHGMFGALPKYTSMPNGSDPNSRGFGWPVQPTSLYEYQSQRQHRLGGRRENHTDWLAAAFQHWYTTRL